MAVGRADYQAGVVPIKSGYSLYQVPTLLLGMGDVASLADDYFCEWTPSAGYQFNVVAIRISSSIPFRHKFDVLMGGSLVIRRYFDSDLIDNFPEGYQLVVNAGTEFRIRVYNLDEVTTNFSCNAYGWLEQIES